MSTALTLYSLEENLVALLDSQEMTEGDEQAQLEILREIAQANQAAVQKRDNLIRFFRHLDLQEASIDTEIRRLQALKGDYARGKERLEKYVISVMEELVPAPKKGAKKLEGSIGVLTLKKNPDSVEIEDETAVPNSFKDVTVTMSAETWLGFAPEPLVAAARKIDYRVKRAEVKDALKAGKEVPGADMSFGALRLEVK